MDPLSVSAHMASIFSLSSSTVSLLNDVRDKPNDALKLILELSSLSGLLQSLLSLSEERQEEAEWPKLWRSLLSPRSPLVQLQQALEILNKKLSSSRNLRKTSREMRWPFPSVEMQEFLIELERAHSVIALALTVDRS